MQKLRDTHPERFERLSIGQELEQRGGSEQQEGAVDGLPSLQTRQGELVQTVTRFMPHCRLEKREKHKLNTQIQTFLTI